MSFRPIRRAALTAIFIAAAAVAEDRTVPLLTVNSDNSGGSCLRIPFELENTGNDQPLRINISDDTPSGSGESIRASVWLAAITAAMQRNDPMSGVKIKLEFSGTVDGPSAGSMLCLAIMSARDGREIPADFAMTGTVMPDGTVGPVDGVAQKLAAAAEAGIKRACIPAFMRFEKQPDKTDVDLFRLGDKLGIKVIPVQNISEAYAAMHNLSTEPATEPDARVVCRLAPDIEDVLIHIYKLYTKSAEEAAEPDSQFFPFYGPDPEYAETLFRSGRLLEATAYAFYVELLRRAGSEADIFFKKFCADGHASLMDKGRLPTASFRKDLTAFQSEVEKYKASLIAGDASCFEYIPDRKWISPICAQFESTGTASWLLATINRLDARTPDESVIRNLEGEALRKVLEDEFDKLGLAMAYSRLADMDGETRRALAAAIPQIKPNKQAKQVEALFYSAWRAVNSATETDNLRQIAEDEDIAYGQLIDNLTSSNQAFAVYRQNCVDAAMLHSLLENPQALRAPEYQTIVSMHAQANTLAKACAVMVEYGPETEMCYDGDGAAVAPIRKVDGDLLHSMIRSARVQALLSIAECARHGIPCIEPIRSFEAAERERDDSDSDHLHHVLAYYWRAGLNAKALLMAFGPVNKIHD